MRSMVDSEANGVVLFQRPPWPLPVTLAFLAFGFVALVAPFYLLVATRDVSWTLVLAVPVVLSGLLFGAFPGATTGLVLVVASGLVEQALGVGVLRSVTDYLLAGAAASLTGGAIGQASSSGHRRGRLVASLLSLREQTRRNEEMLRRSERRYRDLFEKSDLPLWEIDVTEAAALVESVGRRGTPDLRRHLDEHPEVMLDAVRSIRILEANEAALGLVEAHAKEEVIGPLEKTLDPSDSKLHAVFRDILVAMAEGRGSYEGEVTAKTFSGKAIDLRLRCRIPPERERPAVMLLSAADVTEDNRVRRRAVHLNRLSSVLAETNQATVRFSDRDLLFREVCRIAVERGGFRMAWIGLVDDQTGFVHPIASAGFVGTYLDTLSVSTANDTPEGLGPVGRAIRERKAVTSPDMWHEPDAAPWSEAARVHGYRSTASVPLRSNARVEGVFAVYSEEAWFFDADEIALIEEIGERLSPALQIIDAESQRRRTEEVLEKERNLLRALIDVVPHAIFAKDIEGRKTLANPVEVELSGCTSESQVLGKTDQELFPPEIAASFLADDQLIVQTRKPLINLEWAFVDRRGRKRWFLSSKLPLLDGEGSVVGIVGISEDITARKEWEARTREQAKLLDISSDAIIVRDIGNRIRYWNRSAETTFGWSADEAIGKDIDELLHRESRSEAGDAFRSVIEHGEWTGDLACATKSGKVAVCMSRWTLVHDEGGIPRSILCVSTEVTEKRAVQAQLLRAQRLESLGTLAGGIAHDLNNVLAPILMGLESLAPQIEDEEGKEVLATILRSAQRGANVVRQVLGFARGIEDGGEEILLGGVIEEAVAIVRETFPKSIELVLELPDNLRAVRANETHLHQVILNLCLNARDAMPNGGRLTILAENVELDEAYVRTHLGAKPIPYVMIEIVDTGTGMSPEVVDKIFDPFFTTKEPGRATGLGLSTTLSIVKGLGGFINVYSEPGQGSSFRVYLPAVVWSEAADAQAALAGEPVGHGELILVVDDEEAVRDAIKRALELHGFRALTAGDGATAVAVYMEQREETRCVITDMMLPHMNGAAIIRVLRKLDPHLKIIAISGLLSDGYVAEARGLGAQAFLTKPFATDVLVRTLIDVLRSDH